jgi:hypothetical protein
MVDMVRVTPEERSVHWGRLVAAPRSFINDTLPRAAAADEVEDFGAEVGEPLLADALAPQQRGG